MRYFHDGQSSFKQAIKLMTLTLPSLQWQNVCFIELRGTWFKVQNTPEGKSSTFLTKTDWAAQGQKNEQLQWCLRPSLYYRSSQAGGKALWTNLCFPYCTMSLSFHQEPLTWLQLLRLTSPEHPLGWQQKLPVTGHWDEGVNQSHPWKPKAGVSTDTTR